MTPLIGETYTGGGFAFPMTITGVMHDGNDWLVNAEDPNGRGPFAHLPNVKYGFVLDYFLENFTKSS